jgi:hypothetical protein
MLRYRVVGGRGAPPSDERLEIDDDRFTLWRSTGLPLAGRFAGQLTEAAARDVAAAEAAAIGARPPDAEVPPDAPIETVELGDGTTIELGHRGEVEGPWGELVEHLRRLADDLVDHPAAAIALELAQDERSAGLVHRGPDPVGIDLSAAGISVHAWKGYYEPAGRWLRGPMALDARGAAGRGWRVDLPFDHGLKTGAGRALQVAVDFSLRDGDQWRRVSVVHVPVIPPPGGRGRS